jgi:GT2 family glycosyltransferase
MMKILIAVPTFENIEPETFKSIYGLRRPESATVMFDYIKGYDVARARNMIAREALDYDFNYVLMVDSDVVLPAEALERLVAADKDIVTGWYPRKRTTTGQTEIFTFNGGHRDFDDFCNLNVDEMPSELMPIKGCGLGCALIKTEVFRKISESKWFEYKEYPSGHILSEDTGFCVKAAEAGYEIWLEPKVACGHINKVVARG